VRRLSARDTTLPASGRQGECRDKIVAEFFGLTSKASDQGDPTETPVPESIAVRLMRTIPTRSSSVAGRIRGEKRPATGLVLAPSH
jgi:hypothetical protein